MTFLITPIQIFYPYWPLPYTQLIAVCQFSFKCILYQLSRDFYLILYELSLIVLVKMKADHNLILTGTFHVEIAYVKYDFVKNKIRFVFF